MTPFEDFETAPLFDIIWLEGCRVADGQFVEITHHLRLFYMPHPETGFDFVCVEFESSDGEGDDQWKNKSTTVGRICWGVAYFDGIRHLHMPYVYYPPAAGMVKLFEELKRLEFEYCPISDQHDSQR